MIFQKFRTDDNAVSPVIGVILMVAITVILAAVIASFVLGLGQQNPGVTTQASFSFEETSSGDVVVTHDSGDALTASNLYIRGGSSVTNDLWTGAHSGEDDSGEVKAGHSATVAVGTGNDYTIRVVYETDDGSNTLQTQSGTA